MLVAVVAGALVVIGAVGFMMMGGKDDPKADPQAGGSNDAAVGTPEAGVGTSVAPSGATEASGAMPAKVQPEAPKTAIPAPAVTNTSKPVEAATPTPAEPVKPAGENKPADEPAPTGPVVTKFEFELLERAPGTTDDEWKELQDLGVKLKETGAPRKRAMRKLAPFAMKAVPVAINFLNGLDLTSKQQWVDGYEIAVFIQDELTAGTILIPYHADFSEEPAEINRTHKVLTSILKYWRDEASDPIRWERLLQKYTDKKAGKGASSGE